jgi:ParB-like chromosome segregation protein Spo0J
MSTLTNVTDASPTPAEPKAEAPASGDRLAVHPLADRFPKMPEKDFEDLKESIRKYGLFESIVVNKDGQILDGRHRYRAITDLGKNPCRYIANFEEIRSNDDLTEEQFIYDSNIHRRHLTDDQRVMLAAEFAPYFRKEGEERKAEGLAKATAASPHTGKPTEYVDTNSSPSTPRDIQAKHAASTVGKVAEKADVSEYKASQALKVAAHPEISGEVISGEKSLSAAVKEVAPKRPTKPNPEANTVPHAGSDISDLELKARRLWGGIESEFGTLSESQRLTIARAVITSIFERFPQLKQEII